MIKAFKLIICIGFVLILTLGMTSTAFAAGSISDDPKEPVVVNPDPAPSYPDDDTYNGSPSNIASEFAYDPEHMETTDGLTVNLRLYDRITDMIDVKKGDITVRADILKDLKKGDVLVMVVDPETGLIYLVSPYYFDPETGEMSFISPCSGEFCIIQKLPLVVRDVHTEEYANLQVAESIDKLPKDKYIDLKAWLAAFDIYDEELEIAKNYVVDVDDYDSANYIADIAVKLNRNVFSYKLNTRMWADLYQDINECDWGRVLDYAGIDYDVEELKKDPTKLMKIKPFILKDCFVYHVDAQTGEVSIAFEPEISFDIAEDGLNTTEKKVKNGLKKVEPDKIDLKMNKLDDVDNVNEVEDNVNHKEKKELEDPDVNDTSLLDLFVLSAYAKPQDYYTKEQRDILTFDINDIDEKNIEDLCMVMSSDQYLGMGPFILMMPKEKHSLWWLWLILILLILIALYVFYRRRKEKRRQEENMQLMEGLGQENNLTHEDI